MWGEERDNVLELSPESFARKRQRALQNKPLFKPKPRNQFSSRSRRRRRRSRSSGRRRRRSRSYERRRSRSYDRRRRQVPVPVVSVSPQPPDLRKKRALTIQAHPYKPPTWSEFPGKDKAYIFQVIKEGVHILNIPLFDKANFTTFGKDESNEINVLHPSTSRFHCAVQFGKLKQLALFIFDLGSTHGTIVNGIRLKPKKFTEIVPGDRIQLGASKRVYLLVEGSDKSQLPLADQNEAPQVDKPKKRITKEKEWEKELKRAEHEVGVNPIKQRHIKILESMQGRWDWRDPMYEEDRLHYLEVMKKKVGYGKKDRDGRD